MESSSLRTNATVFEGTARFLVLRHFRACGFGHRFSGASLGDCRRCTGSRLGRGLLRPRHFTTSISLPKLSTTSYRTLSAACRLFISAKNLRAHSIFFSSIGRKSMLDMLPLVSATK